MPSAVKKSVEQFDSEKQEILDRLGDISQVEIAQNECLIATYMRPEKTAGGIVLPHQNLKEDQYQGKVGLVVKIGSACRFVRTSPPTIIEPAVIDPHGHVLKAAVTVPGITYGLEINLYDWVVVRTSDTWPLELNGKPGISDPREFVKCRLVYDDQIRMKVPRPSMVW